MKPIQKQLFILFALFVASMSIAQEFNATITYSITYKNLPVNFEAYKSGLPKEMKVLLKGQKSKTVQTTPSSGTTATITNAQNKQTIILTEFLDAKNATVINYEDIEEKAKNYERNVIIKYIDDTTTKILNFNCKKALIYLHDNSSKPIEVFYTEEIKIPDFNKQFKKLNGYPLQYTISTNELIMEFKAVNIDYTPIDDSEFEIPDGFNIIPYSDF